MIQLRDYQKTAISKILDAMEKKSRNLIVLPTGSGKTVVFCSLSKQLNRKTLVVAHTKELIDQIYSTSARLNASNIHAQSIQWCTRNLEEVKKENYELLIIDECHRICATSYKKLIDYINPTNLLGFTATPYRTDKKKIRDILGSPIFSMNLIEMIEKGFLCDFEGYRTFTNVSLSTTKTKNGDFTLSSLSPVINVSNRNELIVSQYEKIANGEKTLCFCIDVNHAIELSNCFNQAGINSKALFGSMARKDRENIIKDFRSGKITVLTNCQILTEGFDDPFITCLLMARPTISKTLYLQMIGRGSRKSEGKEVCKVIEFTDNDFDVCQLDAILDKRSVQLKPKQGERLSSLYDRNQILLKEEGKDIVTKKEIIIPKTIYERPATDFQIHLLNKLKIPFQLPISEFLANKLISKGINGNNTV